MNIELAITVALFGILFLIVDQFKTEFSVRKAYEEIDELHRQEWTGEADDELLAWYRARNRMFSKRYASAKEFLIVEDVFRARIEQTRARNKTFQTLHRGTGRITIISTQN